MFKKVLSLVIVAVVMNVVGIGVVCAQSAEEAAVVAKVRESVRKLGVGEASRVDVKLTDGTKLKGYILEIRDDTFVVVDRKTGASIPVDYRDITQIKGSNRLTAAKIGLDAAKAVGVVAAFVAGLMLLVYVTTKEN